MKQLDVRGLPCPGPVIETKKALRNLAQGKIEVLLDNNISVENVQKMAQTLGYPVQREEKEGVYKLLISKDGNIEQGTEGKQKKIVLFLGSDNIGRGSDELGKVLMKSYLYALSESTCYPTVILLMNSGVKNAVEGSDTLKSLQTLVEKGVDILVCGTCLDYFSLKEKIAVGRISNMYDISEQMLQADKVISFS